MNDASLGQLLARRAPLAPVSEAPELVAHQAPDVFGLWEAWEAGDPAGDPRDPPFWAVVWPAAAVLARYLLDHPTRVAGRRVLEIGCGGAVAGIAAARAGAALVVANDVDPAALRVAARNAAANGVELSPCGDDLLAAGAASLDALSDVVLVADFFYQRAVSARLTARLRGYRGVVLVADAGRPFVPEGRHEVLAAREVPVDREVEGVDARTVRVLELALGEDGR